MTRKLIYVLFNLAQLCLSAQVSYPPDRPPHESVNRNVSSPTNNAPLDTKLAYYKLNGTNGKSNTLTHSFVRVSCGAMMSVHHTEPDVYSDAGTKERPILILNHGYPESSYIWRKLTAALSKRVPLVVPDVSPDTSSMRDEPNEQRQRPGYGLSQACPNGTDERTNAGAILETVSKIFGEGKTVILAGHDRGARAMQRAAVDLGQGGFPFVKAAGVWMADVSPHANYDGMK